MNSTLALLLSALACMALCSGCDTKTTQDRQEPATSDEELALSGKAQDCVTEHIKKNFTLGLSDLDQARAAVLACEEHITRFERLRGLNESGARPELEELRAERSASASAARSRAHVLRLESWRLSQKVAEDYRAALGQGASSPSRGESASQPSH